MMSWRLWRALSHPNMKHPFFRYVFQRTVMRPGTFTTSARELIVRLIPFFGSMMLCWLYTTLPARQEELRTFFVVLIGVISSARYVLGIVNRIADEREMGRYDLVRISPNGELIMQWVLVIDWHDRQPRLWQLTVSTIAAILSVSILQATSSPSFGVWIANFLWQVGSLLLFSLIICADYVQRHTLAALSAMVVNNPALERYQLQLATLAFFLLLELMLSMSAVAAPALFFTLIEFNQSRSLWVILAGIALISPIITLFVGRELLLRALWSRLQNQLDVDRIGLNAILRGEL